MNELKPCPFCGYPAYLLETEYNGHSYYYPYCDTSDCIGTAIDPLWEDDKDVVVSSWNSRISPWIPIDDNKAKAPCLVYWDDDSYIYYSYQDAVDKAIKYVDDTKALYYLPIEPPKDKPES